MKVACITSIRGVGCTFVDWSLHFLSNQTEYYRPKKHSFVPLSMNPVITYNAHGHKKNHPMGLAQAKHYIECFQTQPDIELCSMYARPMRPTDAMQILNFSVAQLEDSAVWTKVLKFISDDYQALLDYCSQSNDVVYVDPPADLNLYFLTSRNLEQFTFSNIQPTTNDELVNEVQDIFFHNSIVNWQNNRLSNVWDIRERMALDTRPFDRIEDRYQLNLSMPHLWIDSRELWNHGEETIPAILNYLNIPINNQRWKDWLPIYHHWHTIQQQHLKFAYQFDHIIDAIVNNHYYKLDNLSFDQEVAIQHALIYQHNLNLKTWQLDKFPSNTQDIHKLLEPNIHLN
jgi:hypothetical protein